jgi:hypothetical protein
MKSYHKPYRKKAFSTMFSPSTRLTLTYIVLFIWIALAVFAILVKADLYALATYFVSGLPVILGYLWAQTSRPSLKDAAEIVKNISPNNQLNQPQYNQPQYNQPQYDQPQSEQQEDNSIVTIYSNDATSELKISQSQLSTLLNVDYIELSNDKYVYDKNSLSQIKALLFDNVTDPII